MPLPAVSRKLQARKLRSRAREYSLHAPLKIFRHCPPSPLKNGGEGRGRREPIGVISSPPRSRMRKLRAQARKHPSQGQNTECPRRRFTAFPECPRSGRENHFDFSFVFSIKLISFAID